MKKSVIVGAVAFCLLLGGSVVAYAAGTLSPLAIEGPDTRIIGAEMKEKVSDMSAYEQYGLVYNQNKGGYCYNGKLVGLLIDPQSRGISYLSKNGEVHIKAIRDNNGNLTGFVELSADEYNAIISDMDAKVADIEVQLEKDFAEMENFMGGNLPKPPKPDLTNGLDPADLEQHMNEVSANLEQHMNEIHSRLSQRISELHSSISENR